MISKKTVLLALSIGLAVLPREASASSFQILELSANSVGYAYSNIAASAEGADTAFNNPAGMTLLDRPEIAVNGAFVDLKTTFKSQIKLDIPESLIPSGLLPPELAALVDGGLYNIRAPGDAQDFIPAFNLVYPLCVANTKMAFGLSVGAPWGLETNYAHSTVTGYAERTCFESYNINPSFAIKLFDKLSLAVGADYQLFRTNFTAAIIILGIDAQLKSWKWNWDVSALYEFTPYSRVGLTYRPGTTYHLKGYNHFLTESAICHADLALPDTLNAGFYHELNCDWSFMGTFSYTFWSKVKEVNLQSEFENNLGPSFQPFFDGLNNVVVPLQWKNSWLVSLGMNYKATETWQLKGGIGFDKTPTHHSTREIRLPDSDRYYMSLGSRSFFGEHVIFDFGYMFAYLPKKHIDSIPFFATSLVPLLQGLGLDIPVPPTTDLIKLSGETHATASIFAAQLSWRF